jgi:EAL domain-containing protein (putative c-di-GMP-specific phosphodiesterase class I)
VKAVVRAIASLGQHPAMATVAEGVETGEQMARIVSDGCADVQGYLINRPILPEPICGFLLSQSKSLSRRASARLAAPALRTRREKPAS